MFCTRVQDASQPGKKDAGLKPGTYKCAPVRASREELSEDVVYGLGVGLAAGGAHDLAYEKLEDAFVAGFEFGDVVRIFFDDFVGGLFDGGFVDLGAEAFGSDDISGRAAGVEHGGENFFCDSGGDLAGVD